MAHGQNAARKGHPWPVCRCWLCLKGWGVMYRGRWAKRQAARRLRRTLKKRLEE